MGVIPLSVDTERHAIGSHPRFPASDLLNSADGTIEPGKERSRVKGLRWESSGLILLSCSFPSLMLSFFLNFRLNQPHTIALLPLHRTLFVLALIFL